MKRIRHLQTGFYMHAFASQLGLFIIVQSICRIFFITFTTINRKLLHIFGFDKLPLYDVTIPGNDSQITWKLPTILPNIHTKIKFIAVGEQCFFNANSKLKTKVGLLWYKASWSLPYMCIDVHGIMLFIC